MNDYLKNKPVIFIDQKKYRIRIYKRTLHLLGNPEYIRLLVNPKNLTVAIQCTDHVDKMTHKIAWKNLINKQSYELYSRYLICKLQNVCDEWVVGISYKLTGKIILSEKMAQFDLRDIVPYKTPQEADNE